MLTPPTHRIHALMGRPARPDCADLPGFVCWVCAGTSTRGIERTRWMGAGFVSQNRVRAPDSNIVCEPCVIVMSGKPPDTLRMYSHLVDDRGWLKYNKGHKAEMRAWLRGPKHGEWFAAIADSGKKHVIPWTPINTPETRAPRVLFEERLTGIGSWEMVDDMSELLTLGATKAEIETGDYSPRAWQLCGERLRAFVRDWQPHKGGDWFDLAIWLAQRDEARVKEREDAERERRREAAKSVRRVPARGARRVPADAGSERAEELGPTVDAHAERGEDVSQRGAMGDGHGEVAAPGGAQCELFGGTPSPGRLRARARAAK